ncbi:hypothetical protein [Pseudorhodoferax sp.]|uniref:hypothetical protein n=1 Tax=Pseudorhodoferax sp. TaxID=1993553 RepID=UPI0039E5321E
MPSSAPRPAAVPPRRLLPAVFALLLAACGTVESLSPGMAREEVVARWGLPTRVVPLGQGQRLQYTFQGNVREAVMVDLDAAGRVVQARQVLNTRDFARVPIDGSWTRADVEREFGPPFSLGTVARWDGAILTYRWHDGPMNQLFWVYLDPDGRVRRTQTGIELRQFRDPR